jgi:hypothetical protein
VRQESQDEIDAPLRYTNASRNILCTLSISLSILLRNVYRTLFEYFWYAHNAILVCDEDVAGAHLYGTQAAVRADVDRHGHLYLGRTRRALGDVMRVAIDDRAKASTRTRAKHHCSASVAHNYPS